MKIKNLIVLVCLALLISFSANAHGPKTLNGNNTQNHNGNNIRHGNNNRHGNNTIGAPLDGGLLTILGAAGVAYFVSRKKKKNGEEA